MLIFRSICTSARENTKTACCTAQIAFAISGDHKITPVYGDHLFLIYGCVFLSITSLSKGGWWKTCNPWAQPAECPGRCSCAAGGSGAIPAKPCPDHLWIPTPNTDLGQTVHTVQWDSSWKNISVEEDEWGFLWCSVAVLKASGLNCYISFGCFL